MVIESLLQALSISTDCHYLIRIPWFFSCQEWFLKLPFLTEFGARQGMMRMQRVPKEHFQRCLSLGFTNEIKWANAHKPRNILSCCTHIKSYLQIILWPAEWNHGRRFVAQSTLSAVHSGIWIFLTAGWEVLECLFWDLWGYGDCYIDL